MLCNNNLSIGFFSKMPDFLLKVKENKIEGMIGRFYDEYAVHRNKRDCKFKEIHFVFGEQLSNDLNEKERNLTAFHLFKHKYLDVWADPSHIMNSNDQRDYKNEEELKFVSENIQKSKVIFSDPYIVAQILKTPSKAEKLDQLTILINNKLILMMLVIGYFVVFFINLFSWWNVNRKFKTRKRINRDVFNFFFLDIQQLRFLSFKIALFYLFFVFFRFFNLSLFCSNIKTDVVIVKTEEIIDSVEKLMSSKKIFLSFNYDSFLFTRAPKNSFLNRFFARKLQTNKYLNIRELESMPKEIENEIFVKNKLQSYFLFTTEITVPFSLTTLSSRIEDDQFIFMMPKTYYELLKVIYMRKEIEDFKKKLLNTRIENYFEHGLYYNVYYKIERTFRKFIKPDIKIFTNVKDFIKEYSSSTDLGFDNFKNIIICFFVICSCVLLALVSSKIKLSRWKRFSKRKKVTSKKKVTGKVTGKVSINIQKKQVKNCEIR